MDGLALFAGGMLVGLIIAGAIIALYVNGLLKSKGK